MLGRDVLAAVLERGAPLCPCALELVQAFSGPVFHLDTRYMWRSCFC